MEVTFSSGCSSIPEEIKPDLLTKEELELFSQLTDEEKKDVFNSLDLEGAFVAQLTFAAPLSTLRLMAKSFEVARDHMPEITRETIDAMRAFFMKSVLQGLEAAHGGVCEDCGGPLIDHGDGSRPH